MKNLFRRIKVGGGGRWAHLEIREVADAGPCFLVGGAKVAEHAEQLVDFAVAGEKGAAVDHLGEDAAHGPHVDGGGVVLGAEQDFRGAVPQSDDLKQRE
jgi:hypothetical protein